MPLAIGNPMSAGQGISRFAHRDTCRKTGHHYLFRASVSGACRRAEGVRCRDAVRSGGWVQGENKLLHWRTLLCARAIENGLTVFGADQYAPGKFVGHSVAFQPDGTALGELGEEQDLLIVKIN